MFQVHGVDAHGRTVLRKQLARHQVAAFFANLPPCLVGMEACGSAHFWARKLSTLGHVVKLMAPQFVKPYVKGSKTDAADAEAICEAVSRPNMRFVPVKQPEQQALLAVHRARAAFVKARTAQANQLRGLLAEFGMVIPLGLAALRQRLPMILEDAENGLPGMMRELVARLVEHLQVLDQQVAELERQIQLWHRQSEPSRQLAAIPGIGPITATALVASIGDARSFANGRQLAAWLGLVPRQHSSGGKPVLRGISKRGDVYLRTLLIHGARAVIGHFERQRDQTDGWLKRLLSRRHRNISVVALANKNARIVWALLANDRQYSANYPSTLLAA
ncbi:IS110 family transposase [Crenobacter cavernae]|uniref:IS110 family transposase n=1 Tax=Crenobacter cavernae TaxID=2290923 RepID=A0A345Y8H3_9NEIS|nr:IS110 family transposase [Crenobacter cavernae]AXK40225.1 IS110 family transposase [Crenobacter cavernae]